MSITFSNVPGPRVPLIIQGLKSKKMMFYVPGIESVASGISIITHEHIMKIGVCSDTSQIKDPH